MDTLESLDAMLKDYEEEKGKIKDSIIPCLQMYSKVLKTAEEQYLDRSGKQKALNSKVDSLNDKLHQLLHEASLLSSKKSSLINTKEDLLNRIQEKEEEFHIQEEKIASRHKAVSLCEEHLYMKLKSVGRNHVLFIFKGIDPAQPDHCCLFQLLVENKIYKVTRCAPELPDVDVMLSELNATNDLHKFVVSMRNKFHQSVCYS